MAIRATALVLILFALGCAERPAGSGATAVGATASSAAATPGLGTPRPEYAGGGTPAYGWRPEPRPMIPVREKLYGHNPPFGRTVVKETPVVRVAALEHVGSYAEIDATFTILQKWVKSAGVERIGHAMADYMHDPDIVPPADLRAMAYIPIKAPDSLLGAATAAGAAIEVRDLPAGRFLSASHPGPYETVRETWKIAFNALAEMPTGFDGFVREVYFYDRPALIPANNLTTEVLVALGPRPVDALTDETGVVRKTKGEP